MIDVNVVSLSNVNDPNGVSKFILNFVEFANNHGINVVNIFAKLNGKVEKISPSDVGLSRKKEFSKVKTKKWHRNIKGLILNGKFLSLVYLLYSVLIPAMKVAYNLRVNYRKEQVNFHQDMFVAFFASVLLKNKSSKNVLVLHCSDEPLYQYYHNSPGLDNWLGRFVLNYIFCQAVGFSDEIVTLGQSICESLHSKHRSKKFTFIMNGTPKIEEIQVGEKNRAFKICCVGSVIYRKGQDLLVYAMKDIKNRGYEDIECEIFGSEDESFSKVIKNYCKKNALNVRFNGVVSSPLEKMKFDLFVLPSRNEGLPLAIIEASSVKLPILSTDVGSIKEAFGDSIFYTELSAKSLSDNIVYLYNNKQVLENKKSICYDLYCNKLSVDSMMLKYADLFKGL